MMYESTDRWYFTADRSRVVRESDPAAAFLYVAAGGRVPMEEARRYGIVDAIADAVSDAIVDAVTDAIEDAVEWVADQVTDLLDGDDGPGENPYLTGDARAEMEAAEALVNAATAPDAVETPEVQPDAESAARPIVETKPITPKRRRR